MWALGKRKISNVITKVVRTVHLNAEKTISWYSYILLAISVAFWLMIELQVIAGQQTWTSIMKQPTVAVGIIISIVDFLIAYYLFYKKKDILSSYENYRFFMMTQAIGQVLVGNMICFVFALIGIHESKKIDNGPRSSTVTAVSVFAIIFLIMCFGFMVKQSLLRG